MPCSFLGQQLFGCCILFAIVFCTAEDNHAGMINAVFGITVLQAFLAVVNIQFRAQLEVAMLYQVCQCTLGCRQNSILSVCRYI